MVSTKPMVKLAGSHEKMIEVMNHLIKQESNAK